MFTKLRNRFLVVNLVIISFMMLVAFAAIYTITYQNVHNDIDMELGRVSEFYHKPDGKFGGEKQKDGDHFPMGDGSKGSGKMNVNPPPERSVSFSLQTDEQWNITATNSRFDMDSEFYSLAISEAASAKSNAGQFTLDGNRWAYRVQTNEGEHQVVFLDVTAQQKIITNLVYTFAAVGLVMLVAIYFTSRYFANRSIAPVKEAFYKQKQFIADASHELKTPLAVINTNADVLLANSEDTISSQSKWLHRIQSETERMKTLTNDLLYLTEMDDSRASMLFSNFNASESVESVILTMEAVVFERDLSLQYQIEPDLTVRGNSEQIKQVVMILLDNAIKYANAAGTISVTLKKRHHDIMLTVTNTGEGIAPEHLDRIFDRFYRADPSRSRKQGGYGLGLAIAKSIVEQHKGKITAKSTPKESTSFTVQLADR
ncbi:integral membrane sensor signal transduction histidine kinase [Paenibacillus curdlanolyticus YK9]|uniref:histidine kinase n=1 Tax=Paenibacillus curdlanolyticus YK9 TaxID=717606 RepID=E0I9Q5_9BACL|nr:HAMP domain-containing sensor histidine kinase [Paenibacillus curdlanolyticus]EFM11139.1 integral membrane sensor signal transduction histidine kinase [Paenibacillus curdlanolyticus YK9]